MGDNELDLDLRRTQLMAVDASLSDVRRNLLRAARIPSSFSAELRALLLVVADLDRRVMSSGRTDVEVRGVQPVSRKVQAAPEVPKDIGRDYRDAVAVAPVSTRVAAALARRGLQAALRERNFKAPSNKLNDEIDLALNDPRTSSTLSEKLRFVQHVGNGAAHADLDCLGDFVEVAAEDLDVIIAALDEFFETYYVKPASTRPS